jgi:hypothetical protein
VYTTCYPTSTTYYPPAPTPPVSTPKPQSSVVTYPPTTVTGSAQGTCPPAETVYSTIVGTGAPNPPHGTGVPHPPHGTGAWPKPPKGTGAWW